LFFVCISWLRVLCAQALDVIMTQAIRTSVQYTTVGRAFFRNNGEVLDVGFGKEVSQA
jgi:hypothetical protein